MKDLWQFLNNHNTYSPERYALTKLYPGSVSSCPRYEDFEFSLRGLQEFIEELGAANFLTAEEICRPHHPDIASECGYEWLIPPHDVWDVVGCLALIHAECRRLAGSPVYMRNLYRPSCYNSRVGGAERSDHLYARAMDIDFIDSHAKYKCRGYVESLYQTGYLDMSLGEGDRMYHIGILSPVGHRRWEY